MFLKREIKKLGPLNFCETTQQAEFTYGFKETSKVLFTQQQQVGKFEKVKQGGEKRKTAKKPQDIGGRRFNVLLPGYNSKISSPHLLGIKKQETLMIKSFPNNLFHQLTVSAVRA